MIEMNSPGVGKQAFDFGAIQSTELIERFERSRQSSLELFRAAETKRRKVFRTCWEVCALLLKTMETAFRTSTESVFKVYRFFDQFTLQTVPVLEEKRRLQGPPPDFLQRAAANDQSLVHCNVDAVVDSFLGDSRTFQNNLLVFQQSVKSKIGGSMLKEQLRDIEAVVQTSFMVLRSLLGKTERECKELNQNFDEAAALFSLNNQRSIYRPQPPNQQSFRKEKGESSRNTFEKLSAFFNRVKEVFSLFQQMFESSVALVESVESCDAQRLTAIKLSVLEFISDFRQTCPLSDNNPFSITSYLAEAIDVTKTVSFKFDFAGLLPAAVYDLIAKRSGDDQFSLNSFKKFFKSVKLEDGTPILNSLVADKVSFLMSVDDNPPVQSTAFLTTENTIVIYTVDSAKRALQFTDSLLIEHCKLKYQPGAANFELDYFQRGTFFHKKKSFWFVHEPVSFGELEGDLRILGNVLESSQTGKHFTVFLHHAQLQLANSLAWNPAKEGRPDTKNPSSSTHESGSDENHSKERLSLESEKQETDFMTESQLMNAFELSKDN